MNPQSLLHAIEVSGWIIYLMAGLLLAALTITIERAWFLRKVIRLGSRVVGLLEQADCIVPEMAAQFGEEYGWLPHVKVLRIATEHDLSHDFDRISDKLEEAVMREAPGVDRYLWVLDTIVTMAPLLGLLGTIIGMFNSFQVLGNPGNAPTQVTGGVAEALLSTACGLFIAILGLFFFNALNNRVRVIMHQLDTLKLMLVNRMYPHYHEDAGKREYAVVTSVKPRMGQAA